MNSTHEYKKNFTKNDIQKDILPLNTFSFLLLIYVLMEELRTTYEKLYGAPVPVNKKNDEERIKAKIAEANVEDVEEDEGTKELENKTPTQKKSPSNNVTPKTSAPYIPSIHEKRNLEKVAKFNI